MRLNIIAIHQVETGIKYSGPIDVVSYHYIYEETDELIQRQYFKGDNFKDYLPFLFFYFK